MTSISRAHWSRTANSCSCTEATTPCRQRKIEHGSACGARSIEHDSEIGHVPLVSVRHYGLGSTEGVPLGFTDGTALPDGRIVFSTVAEDSSDSYSDGACVAAAIGVLDSQGRLQSLNLLDDCPKVEGIHAQPEDCSFRLWCVTDADDPGVPAALLTVRFPD